MSGSVSQTFGDLFGRLFAMLDRWEFWGRIFLLVIAFAIFNGITGFFRGRILQSMTTQDDNAYSRADGQARIWAIVVIFAVAFIVLTILDAVESGGY